jgi:hypothetical protein
MSYFRLGGLTQPPVKKLPIVNGLPFASVFEFGLSPQGNLTITQ